MLLLYNGIFELGIRNKSDYYSNQIVFYVYNAYFFYFLFIFYINNVMAEKKKFSWKLIQVWNGKIKWKRCIVRKKLVCVNDAAKRWFDSNLAPPPQQMAPQAAAWVACA